MPILYSTEQQVNTDPASSFSPTLTRLADGGFLYVWMQADGTGYGIRARRFDGGGHAHEEFWVNSTASYTQAWPSAVGLADGGFVVVWGSAGQDGSGDSIQARRYNYAGTPLGPDFQVNSFTTGDQTEPHVTALDAGGFVVTWTSANQDGGGYGVYGQRYNEAGAPAGSEFRVNTTTAGDQIGGDSAALAYGGWVTVWRGPVHSYAQIYADNGSPLGGEIELPSTVSVTQGDPKVVGTSDGGFVVVFTGQAFNGTNYTNDIFTRRYDAAGVAVGAEILANVTRPGTQQNSDIAIFADGSFVVTWESFEAGNIINGYARKFAADGTPLTGELVLNDPATGNRYPAAVALADGAFAGAWNSGGAVWIKQFQTSYNGLLTNGDNDAYGSAAGESIYGRGGNDLILGMGGADYIDGGTGQDVMKGGDGFDAYVVDDAGDQVIENPGEGTDQVYTSLASYTLPAEVEQLFFSGTGSFAGTGNALDNAIHGGAWDDTLSGLGGNDFYFVDNAGDVVIEGAGGGTDDRVFASVSYALGAGVQVEKLLTVSDTATTAINLTGNEFANDIRGNAGGNVLDGMGGADTMAGLAGDDAYYVDNAGDRANENAGEGADQVFASISFELGANVEYLTLTGSGSLSGAGNALDNVLIGNSGNNWLVGLAGIDALDGGLGADRMDGGANDDVYYVDNTGDRVNENAGEGTDFVNAAISFELGANVENLTLTGSGNTAGGGNALANVLIGNSGNNWLVGLAGNDQLNGGSGADRMEGGADDDTYSVDNVGDRVIENLGAGTDHVRASITFELGANVENLTLVGSGNTSGAGNALANVLTGGSGNNWLVSVGGNDTLDGGLGADRMEGGTGDDTYYVDNTGDRVIEKVGEGTDKVIASISFELGAEVENLTLTGSANLNGGGNALANVLTGNSGNNWLVGVAGNDVIDGGLGADRLDGGAGLDTFAFTTALGGGNIDTINGFVAADDTIQLENAVFSGLAAGALAAGAFNTGSAATQADDRIIYNSNTGALLFDVDGLGGAAAVQFATLGTALPVTAADFVVI